MSGHTPGEWFTDEENAADECHLAITSRVQVGACRGWYGLAQVVVRDEEGVAIEAGYANAKLIAAAPALLEALETILAKSDVDVATMPEHNLLRSIRRTAFDAIALAEQEGK